MPTAQKKAARSKRTTKKTPRRRRAATRAGRALGGVPPILTGLKRADGCAASVRVGERNGGESDHAENGCCVITTPGSGAKGRSPRVSPHVRVAMAAMGHSVRARLLIKLLEGPATYQALRKATKTEAGPLYHHIAQLRLAGLILPKQRDLYELTRAGRNLVLVAAAMGPILKDQRRRPLGQGA